MRTWASKKDDPVFSDIAIILEWLKAGIKKNFLNL